MPSLDAIAEFRKLTSNYSAEYGLAGAATITTVVKSGTNQLHAEAWEFDRNDAFDARNFFNPKPQKVAELRFNTYGFNVGDRVPLGSRIPLFSSITWSGAAWFRAACITSRCRSPAPMAAISGHH